VLETSVRLERERSRERAHGALLDRLLGPLAQCVGDPLTQNVNVNADDAIVVEHGERGKFYASETMSCRERQSLVTYLAGRNDREIHRLCATLECDLPEYDARVQAYSAPAGEAWEIMLRRHAARIFTLDDYVEQGRMTPTQRNAIAAAIAAKANLLIGGAFNTGKTTILNACLAEAARVYPGDRLAVVQDRRELKPSHRDRIMLFARFEQMRYDAHGNRSRYTYDFADALEGLGRSSADALAWGEIRDPRSAVGITLALNLGLSGLMSTIHADSGVAILERIEELLTEGGRVPQRSRIARAVNFLVHMRLDRVTGRRHVGEVHRVAGVDRAGDYVLEAVA
jgi:Flp pilus assembly CpaF family ATPase